MRLLGSKKKAPSPATSPTPTPGLDAASKAPPSGVQVFIPAALNRPTHTLYSICMAVQPTLQEWTVNRRYSQFLQLRKDTLAALGRRNGCPGCASFALALRKFAFPHKAWLRTNRIVRKRVKSLQEFLQLLVERLYNDLPKCHVCGDQVKKLVRPFLIRGAQPMGDSTPAKIQHSLSLQSYAVVQHRPKRQARKAGGNSGGSSGSDDNSYSSTERTDSDPAMMDLGSPTEVDFTASTSSSESSGGQQYGDERCRDEAVPLAEALKQVVLADGRESTVEEVAFRLSSMWDAYELEDLLAAKAEIERMSATREEEEDRDEDVIDLDSYSDNGENSDDEKEREEEPVPTFDEVTL